MRVERETRPASQEDDRRMTVHQLHEMLGDLDDTREIVIEATHGGDMDDPLVLAWRGAARRAATALEAWCRGGGAWAYAAYRAQADQADAAQDALASAARSYRP
jgi:hypothetical protein